jgi:hypothetical protein
VHLDAADAAGRIGQVKIYFSEPNPNAAEELWFEPNSILVEEWYQHIQYVLQPDGAQAFLVDYPTNWNTFHELFFWPSWMPVDGIYHLTIRAVDYDDGSNKILKAGPASLYSVAVTVGAVYHLSEICDMDTIVTVGRDLVNPTTPPYYPTFPPGGFTNNTFTGAGGGTPPKPPPMGSTAPPKAPKGF